MKKNFAMAVLAGMTAIIGTGCAYTETNRVGEQVQINMPVLVKPEIETGKNVINGEATVHSILGIFSWGPNTQAVGIHYGLESDEKNSVLDALYFSTSKGERVARNAAAYEATNSVKADIILAPQYTLTADDYFFYKKINCKVKGYPGFVKGVKVIEQTCEKTSATK